MLPADQLRDVRFNALSAVFRAQSHGLVDVLTHKVRLALVLVQAVALDHATSDSLEAFFSLFFSLLNGQSVDSAFLCRPQERHLHVQRHSSFPRTQLVLLLHESALL